MANALTRQTAREAAVRKTTPQTQRVPGRTDQVKNNAGGFVFQVSDKSRLERFLILGTDGGTFYVGEKELTQDNMKFVRDLIRKDEALVRETVVDVSDNGRALRNSPALFVIAALLVYGQDKAANREAVLKVARTATHLFEFIQYIKNLGGMGRSKREAIAAWYTSKDDNALKYQVVKYRQRNNWTHRDVFRVAHPKGVDQRTGNFILTGEVTPGEGDILDGFRAAQAAKTSKEAIAVLKEYRNLPWEALPTQFHGDPEVWKTLFYNGQLKGQALVRQVTRLSRNGAFKDMVFTADYADRLMDVEMIRASRLHPINYLNALNVHQNGQTVTETVGTGRYSYATRRRVKNWDTVGKIADALNDGFHLSFGVMEPARKRTLLGLDVSGSMSSPAMGLDLSCAQVGAAVAMTIARTEPYAMTRGFSYSTFKDLGITPKMNLDTVMRKTREQNFGSTDCSLPMTWALENRVEVDTFVVITDNETYAGRIQPFQALRQYRDRTGIDARLAVLGVTSTGFTIADPTDRGMMDFVGFDANGPRVLTDFSAGRL